MDVCRQAKKKKKKTKVVLDHDELQATSRIASEPADRADVRFKRAVAKRGNNPYYQHLIARDRLRYAWS